MKSSKLEVLARTLSILSLIMLCWVAHRALRVRNDCVHSSFIAFVRIGTTRIDNCRFESRLSFTPGPKLNPQIIGWLDRLAAAEPETDLFPSREPVLTLQINDKEPHAFAVIPRGLQIGSAWLNDPTQLQRALLMGLLKTEAPYATNSQFQLETITDFLQLVLSGDDRWRVDEQGTAYSLRQDARFPVASPSFAEYCRSPFRSLAHFAICTSDPDPDSSDLQNRVWGYRPLLASALWRMYVKLPLSQKLVVIERIRQGLSLPTIGSVYKSDVDNLVDWFQNTLRDQAAALGMTTSGELALHQSLRELDVEAPTHWELTVDLTHTPAWREIVAQLLERSHYRQRERALLFTPDGEVALPSGLRVGWATADIQSQKHVMIACHWPAPHEALHVQARRIFARQTCDRLPSAFWD